MGEDEAFIFSFNQQPPKLEGLDEELSSGFSQFYDALIEEAIFRPALEAAAAHRPLLQGLGLTGDHGICLLLDANFGDIEKEKRAPEFSRFLELFSDLKRDFKLAESPKLVPISNAGVPQFCGRPAQGGESISAAHIRETGTVACQVNDTQGQSYLLGCSHVLAASPHPKPGDEIWQPGRDDGGTARSKIGTLFDYEPIRLGKRNTFDAALCVPTQAPDIKPGVVKLGKITGVRSHPKFDITVHGYGRKSKVTTGALRIKKICVAMPWKSGKAVFKDQYGIIGLTRGRTFAQEGDSGMLVVDDQNQAIGMLFAIASGVNLAYVNPIVPILQRFKVTIAP
jgi:hypothetical protein